MLMSLKPAPLQLGVVTHNGEAMLGFYRDTLELPESGQTPIPGLGVVHKVKCGDNLIKILVLEKPADNEVVRGGFTAATGYRYCSIELNNLDDTVNHCRACGVAVVADISEIRPGVRVAVIADPDGNMIELFQEQRL